MSGGSGRTEQKVQELDTPKQDAQMAKTRTAESEGTCTIASPKNRLCPRAAYLTVPVR